MFIINKTKTALIEVAEDGDYNVILQNRNTYFANNSTGYDIQSMTEQGKKSYIKEFIDNHISLVSSGDCISNRVFDEIWRSKECMEIIENYIIKYRQIKNKYKLHSLGSVSCLEFNLPIKKLYFRGSNYYEAYVWNNNMDSGYAIYLNILDNLCGGLLTVALPKYEDINNIFLEMSNEYRAFTELMVAIKRWGEQ